MMSGPLELFFESALAKDTVKKLFEGEVNRKTIRNLFEKFKCVKEVLRPRQML